MAKNALIISTGYDPEYLRIIEQIALEARKNGQSPVVLDLAPIMVSPSETHSPHLLALAKIETPAQRFLPRLASQGIDVVTPDSWKFSNINLGENAMATLKEATQSALLTYFRTDSVDLRKKRIRTVKSNLMKEGMRSFQVLSTYLSTHQPVIAYVPNGRFPVQRMAKFALVGAGVPVHHFEKGATRDHAFFRSYSPHDRIATQADVDHVLEGLDAREVEQIADEWLSSRLPSANSSNEYAAIWGQGSRQPTEAPGPNLTIGFFTSSQDEFLHLGPDWQLHSWTSQFEAFDALMSHFEGQGYNCFMRVHPNLSTKDHACFRRELAGLKSLAEKHPNLTIYWHDDATSSYELLDRTSGVVVWDSTIGLEASARGIPVWNCAASYYGLVADTRVVLGFDDMTPETLSLWSVDPHRAKRFIACTIRRDLPLTTSIEPWVSWDVSHPPLMVRVASFARSGGAPTFRDSMQASIDPWRHRSFSVNRKLLNAKISRLRGK